MVEMSPEEFVGFRAVSVREFGESRALATGLGAAAAQASAEEQFASLLPKGMDTANNYFWVAKDSVGGTIGWLWFLIRTEYGKQKIFIADIRVRDDLRGGGHGSFMLGWLMDKTREMSLGEVALHVFGFNTGARRLYERLGFEVTSVYMAKKV